MQNDVCEKIYESDGLNIYKIPFDKFKTNTITVCFDDQLSKERVAKNALLPEVLKQGSQSNPTMRDISVALKELYGTVFDCGVSKKGEMQMIYFYLETIKDDFANKAEDVAKKALDLMFEIITKPLLKDGVFVDEYVKVEKDNLQNYIKSKLNDKMSYAFEKCIENMCKGEVYGISDHGEIEDYDKITPESLHEHYKEVLETYPISIYVTGEVKDEFLKKVKELFESIKRGRIKTIKDTVFKEAPAKTREVEESLTINQGKLCMGYRTNVSPTTIDYYKLLVYNSILGGGIHSKLFQNVREKEGLAYYAFSRLDRFKGIMVISTGIEESDKDKVVSIVNRQMEDIQNNIISDYEFDSSKKYIISSVNSMKDSQMSLVDFYMSGNIVRKPHTLDDVLKSVQSVTKQDVVQISKVVKPDTIYFLHGN